MPVRSPNPVLMTMEDLRTPENRERILDLVEEGKSTREAARIIGCGERAIRRWARDDAEFGRAFFMARDLALDSMAEECREIVDGCDGTSKEAIMKARAQADVRKWYLGKMAPKRYGDRLAVDHGGQEGAPPFNVIIKKYSPVEAK